MQAIEVKDYCDLNGNSKRVAFCSARRKIFFQSDLIQRLDAEGIVKTAETIALCAAKQLAKILDWDNEYYGQMVMGTLKNGNYVFVFQGKDNREVIK